MTRRNQKLYQLLILTIMIAGYFFYNKYTPKTLPTKKNASYKILVAKEHLFPGYLINENNTEWRNVSSAPKEAILYKKNNNNIIDKEVTTQLDAGRIILKSHLKTVQNKSTLTSMLKQGMIAKDISVTKTLSTSKILRGDRVDIIFTDTKENNSFIVLSNVFIIDKPDNTIEKNSTKRRIVAKNKKYEITVAVPKKYALLLTELSKRGDFSIYLTHEKNQPSKLDNPSQMPHTILHINGEHETKKTLIMP